MRVKVIGAGLRAGLSLTLVAMFPVARTGAERPGNTSFDEALAQVAAYEGGGDRAPLLVVERRLKRASPAARRKVAARLLAIAKDPGATRDGRRFACLALMRIMTPSIEGELLDLLRDPELADLAIRGLTPLPGEPIDRAFLELLKTGPSGLKVDLLAALGYRRSRPAVPALIEWLAASDAETAKTVIAALGRIGGEAANAALLEAARSGPSPVRREALRVIGGMDEAGLLAQVSRLLLTRLPPADRRAVEETARALARTQGGGPAVSHLFASLIPGAGPEAKVSLIGLLARFPHPSALPPLLEACSAEPVAVRQAAASALSRWPTLAPAEKLLELFRCSQDRARRTTLLSAYLELVSFAGGTSDKERERLREAALAAVRSAAEKQLVDDAKAALRVGSLKVSSGKACELVKDGLKKGGKVYIDREYTFVEIPDHLRGKTFVRASMDDKYVAKAEHISFNTNKPVKVYVGYDHRARSLPAWLQDWQPTNEAIRTSDRGCIHRLHVRTFPAGKIVLGGNAAPGVGSHYITVISE